MTEADSMPMRALGILNFKCFEDQPLELGTLTLLSGLNGTGKSSVLQALLLLRQSYRQGLLQTVGLSLNGDLVQLGTGKDVFYEGAMGDQEEFGFDVAYEGSLRGSWRFRYDRASDVVSLISDPVQAEVYDTSLFGDSFQYLSAERTGPRASFAMSDYQVRQHRQLGPRGEYAAHFLSLFWEQKIAPVLAHATLETLTLKAQLDAWMSEISPGIQIDVRSYAEMDLVNLRFRFEQGGQLTNYYRSTNVGFGITYTLPIILALLASGPGTLVLLENPEAHLHPRGQVRMGELMARAASAGVQVIAESHSDHVLNGIRIAVRRGLIAPEQLCLHFMQRSPKQASSQVVSPRVDSNGRIDQWPDGFFDEWEKSLEELL